MSLSPNSSLVRRTIDLNYANKQRSDSIKWIFINGALFLIFTYDLCGPCAGYLGALHYAEALIAGALGAAALWHARRLLPRRAPPVRLTRAQQRLLGLRDDDLDSSFHITPDNDMSAGATPPRSAPAPADECTSLSPARNWRGEDGAGGARRSAGSAPPSPPDSPPDRAVRDEFIADHTALDHYLRSRERAEIAAAGWSAGVPTLAAYGGGAGVGRAHQLSPLPTAPYAAPAAAGAGNSAGVGVAGALHWHRLHVDPQQLTQFNLNLRRWLHATILERLVREMEACDAELAAGGHEARVGAAGGPPARAAALPAALRRPEVPRGAHPRAGARRLPGGVPLGRRRRGLAGGGRAAGGRRAGAARAGGVPGRRGAGRRRRGLVLGGARVGRAGAAAARAGAAPRVAAPAALRGGAGRRAGGGVSRPPQPVALGAAVPGGLRAPRPARAAPPAPRARRTQHAVDPGPVTRAACTSGPPDSTCCGSWAGDARRLHLGPAGLR